jgi:ribulose-5-phosphate 4-epimerase/fuculose-1-phosphate aldolase
MQPPKQVPLAHGGAQRSFERCPLYCAYLPEWPGPPIGDEEGRIIHEAPGDKRAILLAHHGQLVATATIEEAAVLAVFVERTARARHTIIGSNRGP